MNVSVHHGSAAMVIVLRKTCSVIAPMTVGMAQTNSTVHPAQTTLLRKKSFHYAFPDGITTLFLLLYNVVLILLI